MSRRRKKMKLVKRRTPPGSSPGTVVADPQAAPTTMRIMRYGPQGVQEKENATLADLQTGDAGQGVTWIDVEGLADAKLIEQIGELFHLHGLALEDVVHVHQRAKMEDYGEWVYFVAPMATGNERFCTEQVSLFLNGRFVITFQEGHPGDQFEAVRSRIRATTRICTQGADYLAYAIIDALIDGYFPVLESYGERLDTVEDAMTADGRFLGLIDELHEVRHDLRLLRRAIWPLREATAALLRESTPHVSQSTRVYLRDCYDHVVQLIDLLETFRELSADLRDLHMSAISNRINETMRVLTIISTIFIPLSFIASVYGMNFDTKASPWNMPELEWAYGYPFALGLMLATTVLMLYIFVRKRWITFGRRDV
jgi:magnesium transporter